MKKITIIFVCIPFILIASGQNALNLKDSAAIYFREVGAATRKARWLWDKDLYGPILLVDPITRKVYANYPDLAGLLKHNGEIYEGILPSNTGIANASVNWKGRDWAMIAFVSPLFVDDQDIYSLFGHELFHRAQPSLRFPRSNEPDNNHLDRKDGRIYLRLELGALIKAMHSQSPKEMKTHLTNAFTFRKYRYMLYPGADSLENALELNEGMAEYTGYVISGRNKSEAILHFERQIDKFIQNPTYVRTFAYNTLPIYGFLLRLTNKYWNKEINAKTNLADYFIKKFKIYLPTDISKTALDIAEKYNAQLIFREELAREENTKKLIHEYKKKFIEQPHFEISFKKKNVSFDPRTLIPIEDKGTVYPVMQAIDVWGILTVKNGALMSPDPDRKVTITAPLKIEGREVSGDGWILKLNDGFTVTKDENTGNYKLIKE